jgi:hypothetical protein
MAPISHISSISMIPIIVIPLYNNSFVPISVVVLIDDNRLMIAITITVAVRTDRYANRPDPYPDLFGSGSERTSAHTRGNSDYQCKPAIHGTSPSM